MRALDMQSGHSHARKQSPVSFKSDQRPGHWRRCHLCMCVCPRHARAAHRGCVQRGWGIGFGHVPVAATENPHTGTSSAEDADAHCVAGQCVVNDPHPSSWPTDHHMH